MSDPSVMLSVPMPTSPGASDYGAPVADDRAQRVASALGDIGATRQAIEDKLWKDLEVQGYRDEGAHVPVFVRYRPLSPDRTANAWEKWEKRGKTRKDGTPGSQRWRAMFSAEVLVEACIGVYAEIDDGGETLQISLRKGDPLGPWTKFDPDLAAALRRPELTTAIDVCLALYRTDGDVMLTATGLQEFSGIALPKADEDFTES